MLENLTHPLQCPIFKATKSGGGADPKQDQTPPPFKETVGSALLSHNPPVAVPSAQKGLTSRFGKDTGCNPLAKTTNTTKTSNTPRDETHQSVKQYIHLTTQPTNPRRIRQGRVGREPHSGRKHPQKQTTNQNQSMQQEFIVSYRSISTSKLVTLQCLHS